MRLDLRETYFGRVRERERRSSVIDSWSEDVVVEGWVESGLVGTLAWESEGWAVTVDGEEVSGSGSAAVGTAAALSMEAMLGK